VRVAASEQKRDLSSYLREVQVRTLGGAFFLEADWNSVVLQVVRKERDDRPGQY